MLQQRVLVIEFINHVPVHCARAVSAIQSRILLCWTVWYYMDAVHIWVVVQYYISLTVFQP